jgi:5-methylcytosine-specific restriction endonuclease McrA
MCNSARHNSRPGRESLSKRLGKVARQIKARDGYRCCYCGATAETSGAHLHLDHLTPKAHGGLDIPENLVLACRSCNSARKDMALPAWCKKIGVSARAVRAQARRALPDLAALPLAA